MSKEQEGPSTAAVSGILDAALAIARERRDILLRLKAALEASDNAAVLRLAAELCGFDDQKSDRTDTSVN